MPVAPLPLVYLTGHSVKFHKISFSNLLRCKINDDTKLSIGYPPVITDLTRQHEVYPPTPPHPSTRHDVYPSTHHDVNRMPSMGRYY